MLNFIGLGSAFNTEIGNTSAFLKNRESFLLIDCGGTVFHQIKELNLFKDIKNLYIIITHTHPDHVGSLGEVVFYANYILKTKPKIYFPDKILLQTFFKCIGVENELYNLINKESNLIHDEQLGSIDFEFIPVSHLDTVKAYGLLITINELEKIYYSGDSNEIPKRILQQLKMNQIDYFYQDTCGLEYEGNAHLSINKLSELIEQEYRKTVYCIHHDEQLDINKVKSLGFNIPELYTVKH